MYIGIILVYAIYINYIIIFNKLFNINIIVLYNSNITRVIVI